GSYGHILASRHRLKDGGSTSARRAAAARVQADVRELDRLVVDALNRAGFAAVPIAPSVVLTLDDGGVSTMDLTPFLEFSSLGFTKDGRHRKHRREGASDVRDRGTRRRMHDRQR